jgi:hypothetical protein
MKTEIFIESDADKDIVSVKRRIDKKEWIEIIKVPNQIFHATLMQFGASAFFMDMLQKADQPEPESTTPKLEGPSPASEEPSKS